MAKKWVKFPHADKAYAFDAAGLKKQWPRLHKGDCEPFPKDAAVVDAWRHYHAGEFQQAVEAGLAAGGAGVNCAAKAQTVYANYLEKAAAAKLALFEEAAGWADERRGDAPKDANAHYLYAFALGRYSQGISVAKRLRRASAARSRKRSPPRKSWSRSTPKRGRRSVRIQAEVIAKVGGIVAGMTYGAKKDSALECYQKALKLFPESPIAHIEYANGLMLLFGKSKVDEATKVYEQAAACKPADAMERLDVELAKSELE
jgi:tetratricopeptide (TPR) repeat protein